MSDTARPAETVSESVPARHATPDVAELRRLAEAATPGPWATRYGVPWEARVCATTGDLADVDSTANAELIAATVNALPALLDAAELLADVRDQVTRGALCPMCSTGMIRRTVGLVCQLCGTDYSRPKYASMRVNALPALLDAAAERDRLAEAVDVTAVPNGAELIAAII